MMAHGRVLNFYEESEVSVLAQPMSVPEKLDTIMGFLAQAYRPELGGSPFDPENDDIPLMAATKDEYQAFLEILERKAWIERRGGSPGRIILTYSGWDLVRSRRPHQGPPLGFVAMSFQSDMMDTYRLAIEPALRGAGCVPRMMRDHEHANNIDDEIVAGLRAADFVVAEFTHNRGGVYFEAGFALALGKPVIWLCKDEEEHKKMLHFDVDHFNFIRWRDNAHLQARLQTRILAVVPGTRTDGVMPTEVVPKERR